MLSIVFATLYFDREALALIFDDKIEFAEFLAVKIVAIIITPGSVKTLGFLYLPPLVSI